MNNVKYAFVGYDITFEKGDIEEDISTTYNKVWVFIFDKKNSDRKSFVISVAERPYPGLSQFRHLTIQAKDYLLFKDLLNGNISEDRKILGPNFVTAIIYFMFLLDNYLFSLNKQYFYDRRIIESEKKRLETLKKVKLLISNEKWLYE